MKKLICVGGLLGMSAVAMGAYVTHGLKFTVGEAMVEALMTALRYQLIHAVLIVALGLCSFMPMARCLSRRLNIAGWAFALGICLFSFSIYASAITSIPSLFKITPIGGIIILLAWGILASAPWYKRD
tara:strand:+ start:629 stop:1012 length:384 start_codon:yes stop_codon:yes gene_type:complete